MPSRPLALGSVLLLLIAVGGGLRPAAAQEEEKKPTKVEPLALVINYPYQITGEGRTKIHVCLFKPDFTPAAGAEVKVAGKVVGTADENGVCVFDFVPGSGEAHRLEATLAGDGMTWRVVKGFRCNARTASFRSDQLYVYTDRGVYNPGDDIQVRLIAWELLGEYSAIAGAEVTLLLQTTAGQALSGAKLKTNEDGIAALKLPLPENMPEGDYQLVVLHQQAREVARLKVKRFVPPVINIEHDLKRFLTKAQQTLPVTVDLSYFAGGKIKSSSLKVRVLGDAGREILVKQVAEQEPGKYAFGFDTAELDTIRAELTDERPFKIELTATDSYGRSSTVTRDVVYTRRPYRAVLELDKDDYPPGETVQLLAKVVDLDGKPAKDLKLKVAVEAFEVDAEATTDDSGVATFEFPMGDKAGQAVVTTEVMEVPLASRAIRLNTPKPMVSKVSEPPHRTGIQTHFTVHFGPEYVPVEEVVHVDFTDISGGLVVATTLPIEQTPEGGYRAGGTVTADTWGTMLVNLYCCATTRKALADDKPLSPATVGFITEGQHVTLYPDSELTITVKDFQPRLKPGAEATFEIEVARRGEGEVAVGAALVDNAVISLLDPFEVTPQDRFYNPQLKVISTGGAGVLTWPVVDRNWGSPWRDIAYTNWGFKGPGAWVGPQGLRADKGGAGGGAMAPEEEGDEAPPTAEPAPADQPAKPMLEEEEALKAPAAAGEKPAGTLTFGDSDDGEADPQMDAKAKANGRVRDRRQGQGQRKTPKLITIRTEFPETALWEPLLRTRDGKLTLTVKVPDAITTQRLALVASDRQGGVGLLLEDIEVRQDLYLQAATPDTLTLGDEVELGALVQNLTDQPVKATVSLAPEGSRLEVTGATSQAVELPPGSALPVVFSVRANLAGKAGFTMRAEGAEFVDSVTRDIFVRPAGNPVVATQAGKVTANQPFTAELTLAQGSSYRTAFLNVSFPNVIPALQGWAAAAEQPLYYVGVTGVASRLLGDVALYEWGIAGNLSEDKLEMLRQRMSRAAAALASVQQPDGSWGWFYLPDASSDRGGLKKSVYLTGYVIRALTEARLQDLVVDDSTLARGLEFLASSRNEDGLWSATGAFFWEVNAPETDWALSCDLFACYTAAARTLAKTPDAALTEVKKKIEAYLAEQPTEPGTVAFAIEGLSTWARWQRDEALASELTGTIDYLLSLKREGHWEPHWYHAYGGMVELNARILELLRKHDATAYAAHERELVTWLLAAREAWGAWHNEVGTAAAVRALLKAGAGARAEKISLVEVVVNGRAVAQVTIDPADPFLSAISLRQLELTKHLRDGKNKVEVRYNGNLQAPVTVGTSQWGVEPPAAEFGLELKRTAPGQAVVGEPIAVGIILSSSEPVPFVQVIDYLPTNARADEASLKKLVEEGRIAGYHLTDGQVVLFVAGVKEEVQLSYRVTAIRTGAAHHPGSRAEARYGADAGVAVFTGGMLRVGE